MKLSQGVEWAMHCCVLLVQAPPGTAVRRTTLAGYYGLPDAYLAKHLKSLAAAGVLLATSGPRGGFRLARDPKEITVLDVVEAVEGAAPAFVCTEIRQRGACAMPAELCDGPCGVARVMDDADRAWRASLRTVTVADLSERLPPGLQERGRAWLEDPTAALPPFA
ncbi:Rrf2 family transcriptional regulator [Streptomyces sp. SID14478]|uniref:RrF2 family transcriptional regulator n=1 Tax=Streptomyces sp. SID14478 TaxID=2706073 RepID=UPI0013DFA383|nr:Rrf2 family transcriptional regulator [Streptomyces sp. SID14478]NEB80092.1 Rrf2 family transcriptional regulator [Streptomyces sp. SID14478]